MIRDWLTPDKIKVINSIDSWENAVRLAAEPLLVMLPISRTCVFQ